MQPRTWGSFGAISLALLLVGCNDGSQSTSTGSSVSDTSLAIQGTPVTTVAAGAAYAMQVQVQVQVQATAATGQSVGYNIQNKPQWATFETSTGSLRGVPSLADIGTYPGIIISATDGTATSSLPSFSITVTPDGSSSTSGSSGTSSTSGSSSTSPKSGAPLGINLAMVDYSSSEQPFLNIVKSGGASSSLGNVTGWYTSNNSTWDTGEEAYLQLDSNGYPTSLTASPSPSSGQQFTYAKTLLNYNLPSVPPGATYLYPPGTYRLKFEGQGTVTMAGDASYATGDTCPSNLSLSNGSPNTYVSCTFTVTNPGSSSGLILEITAISSNTDYPRDISVVQEAYAADYDAGAIFNPAFLSAISVFDSLRFMDWNQTNYEFTGYNVAGSISQGATSSTLSVPWTNPSGAYSIVFIDGEQRVATFTLNSTSFAWSGGLTNAINGTTWASQNNYSSFWTVNKSWGNRALPSNAFWNLNAGVPLEVEVALANQIGANPHFNVPLMYSDANIEAMAQLIMSGTGMQTGYSPLSSSLSASFELSNEAWNYLFAQTDVAAALGGYTWPSQPSGGGNYNWNRSYFGMRTAQMAGDLQTAVGSTLFTRVIPVLGAQAADTGTFQEALEAQYWSAGPASNYPIKAVAIAPYWGGNSSASDCAQMTSRSDGGLADFFATLYSQNGASGYSYSSVPAGGWLSQAEGWISSYASILTSYPNMKLIAYEGGQNFYATSSGTCGGWTALVTSAERDARMGTAYTSYLNYWASTVGATSSNINNLYNDIGPIAVYGAWGLLESVMQPVDSPSSAPSKYQATLNYIESGSP